MSDFPPPSDAPNKEKVIEDLIEATQQYINCADPSERVTRQQRVLQSELNGTVEATIASMIHTSTVAEMEIAGFHSSPADLILNNRTPPGRHITTANSPPGPVVPTTEKVLEELRDATIQYLSYACRS